MKKTYLPFIVTAISSLSLAAMFASLINSPLFSFLTISLCCSIFVIVMALYFIFDKNVRDVVFNYVKSKF